HTRSKRDWSSDVCSSDLEGVYTEPYAVTKVEFEDGSVVDLKPKSEPVMEDYTAYMVTDMLKDVVDRGTGTNANVSHLPIAGKTRSEERRVGKECRARW